MLRRFQLSPRALRFFIVALALLQLVAPTWHICEMGGPISSHSASHGTNHDGAHHGEWSAAALAQLAAQAESQADTQHPDAPLICFCAPHEQPEVAADTPRLDGISAHNHATCLAMLLQTMPAQLSAPLVLRLPSQLVAESFMARLHRAPSLSVPRRFLGRAPPSKC